VFNKISIDDINVTGKRVLVRVDFNVPLSPLDNSIMDDSRMRATFPTIKYLVEHRARTILCSHLGRPDGKVSAKLSLAPVANRLSQLIALPVYIANDCIGKEVLDKVAKLHDSEILVLENLRFHTEEESNDPVFSGELATLADIYVDDAFGTAHRAHASNVGITKYLPAYCGLLMRKELISLGKIRTNPEHPFGALLGGAKVSDKIGVVQNILDKVDVILLGGSMSVNILSVKGISVGLSKIENDKHDIIQNILTKAKKANVSVVLPEDVMVSKDMMGQSEHKIVAVGKIPRDMYIVDIGPKTVRNFIKHLNNCKTIFWNGPMGIYEVPKFSEGTRSMAHSIAENKGTTVIGGGSTAEIVEEMKLTDNMTHVSTGGGASLEFLEGKTLPGVAVLLDK
jgi:phosphoglycerate kinase